MAFNWQTFQTRAITAVVFVLVMLVGFINPWAFLILFSVIHFGCWWEYFKLLEKIYKTIFHPYVKLGFMVAGYGLLLGFCHEDFAINGYLLKNNLPLPVSAAGFGLLVIGIFQKTKINLPAFAAAMAGIIYISLSWGLFIDLYGFPTGNSLFYEDYALFFPLITMLCMWINDTMAYIVGSLIGKTPLTSISPKKTWEGTIGGIILCGLVVGYGAFLFDEWFIFNQTSFFYIGLAFVAAIAGTIGDLVESKLKRVAGVKDSGRIMPGHGGFLDRFDSLLLAAPIVWLFVKLMMR